MKTLKTYIKNNSFAIVFILIILFAVFLRLNQIGSNPPSLTWDEASLGYNAYSILKTGRDEYGNSFPLSIRSFDDYKPPLYVYLTIPFVALFGLNEFSVRFPAAIIGVMSVFVIYYLVRELLQNWNKKYKELIALISAFFLAVSPWHLQFSRAAFEGNIGLFFLMLGVLLFIKGMKDHKLILISCLPFILSIYSYHSFRLLIPIFLLFQVLFFWQEILKKKIIFIIFFLSLILLSLPVYLSFIKAQESGSRLSMVTIFSDPTVLSNSIDRIDYDKNNKDPIGALLHNRRIVYTLAIAKGYFDHFNPDFLFFHGDGGVQHHAADIGMLYLWDLPFIIIGIHFLINRRDRYIGILLLLFLLSPLPSAITTGTPHPVRAIALVPGFHMFAAVGVVSFYFWTRKLNKIFRFCIVIFTFSFFILNFLYYFHQYYVHTPVEYGYFWQYGNKEAILIAKKLEENYQNIIMTYRYDQPYIYYLFHRKIDPSWYQKNWDYNGTGNIDRFNRVIGKYQFRNINYSNDRILPKTLLIGTPDEIPMNAKIIDKIYFPDGKLAYIISET